ncbi:Sugar transporter STL1 [Talaromyces islandicus]|uniref:Sugar transporter STL1 n=1 Tax=Talaromyces islandicus TaxID=28573 RepID=A0A0U1LKI0_TALIS|nr:Sugar transporter STL1 [Talaromyces islandicus]
MLGCSLVACQQFDMPYFQNVRGLALQRVLATVCAVAFLRQGYDQSVMNGLLTLNAFLSTMPEIDTLHTTGAENGHNANVQGATVAIYEVGCAFGALSVILFGDRIGRPKLILTASCIVIIGVVFQAAAYSLGQLIAGRIITGLGVGIYTAIIPMYISETAHAKHRGPLVLLDGVFALSGIVLAAWLNFRFYYVKGAVNWRFPIAFQLIFALFMISVQPILPESRRWLIKKDRLDEGQNVISRLMEKSPGSFEVSREVAIINSALHDDHRFGQKSSSQGIFSLGPDRHLYRTLIVVTAPIITQMTGISIIPFYSNTILESTLSGSIARIVSACMHIMLVIGAIIGCLLVERVGRRKLMLFSTGSMVVCQASVAGLSSDLKNPTTGKVALVFYFLAMLLLPIGMFMVPFMHASEISPVAMRQTYAGMAAASSWLFNFLIAEITPVGIANITWKYYLIYASCSAAATVGIYFFYPETQGRSLEQINQIFRQSTSIFDPVKLSLEPPVDSDSLDGGYEEIPGNRGNFVSLR